jgi:uncharacterized damage-inducible protein DinB
MEAKMTKTVLGELLMMKRAEFEEALMAVPDESMVLPGAAGLWSMKDLVAHLSYYERWMAERLDEVRRGVVYTLTELDTMDANQRNYVEYQKFRDIALEDVRAWSRQAFEDLIAAFQALDEAALFAPRQFHGAQEPVTLHDLLGSEVIDHYGEHLPSILRMAKIG